jgi:non-lysosomal glucosylceramidase
VTVAKTKKKPDVVSNRQRTFKSDAGRAAFLLGGIGTGNVSVGSRGELRDWEIFNRPEKGNHLPYTGFYIWAKSRGKKPVAKVLEAQLAAPHDGASGYHSNTLAGLPRFPGAVMRAEYPFVHIDFKKTEMPVQVSLEAFTPFIPLSAEDSAYPAAILRYHVKNTSALAVEVSLAGSLANATGGLYKIYGNIKTEKPVVTAYREDAGLRGLWCTSPEVQKDSTTHGTMALVTDMPNVTAKPSWLNHGWWDGAHDFWDDFSGDGELSPASYGSLDFPGKSDAPEMTTIGALAVKKTIKPGVTETFQFILAWHFPNRIRKWETKACCGSGNEVVRNHYATMFSDAWDVSRKLLDNLPRLEKASRDFHRALFTSTLPGYVIDALASNITVLRSNTCFRLEDGTFAGWEGCFDSGGCCEGSCTHVWNYAQTLAFLFPELEQTMRSVEFGLETDETGKMAFRTRRIFNREDKFVYHAAADGQNGTVIRLYRDWKFSGDNNLVRGLWPHVCAAIDFAFTTWDSDGDCVLDSQQHNTYDIEFYGPNSLVNSLFFGALKAGAEMAEMVGDKERAQKWQGALERGSRLMDKMLWNGEYYIQKLDDVNKYRYQYGKG